MTVVAEGPELIKERTDAFVEALEPEDRFQLWAVSQAALHSLRIERCQRMEGCARDKIAIRAELVWDDDRRLEAIRLTRKLGDEPELVVEQLRQTPQGCDWLMSRWSLLANAADLGKGWTPDQARLALDLLGKPTEFREGIKPSDDPAAFARREYHELVIRRDLVAGLDEANKALAEADLDDETGPELKRLRRYESALQRQLRWYLDLLREPSKAGEPPPRQPESSRPALDEPPPEPPAPSPPPLMEPEPEPPAPPPLMDPESSPSPSTSPAVPLAVRFANVDLPFGIKPTLDQFVEFPEGLPGRAERNIQKAEGRREAKRRKLERLRS